MIFYRGCKDCGEVLKFHSKNLREIDIAWCKNCKKYREWISSVDLYAYAVAEEQVACGGNRCVGACSCPPCVDGGEE